MSTSSSMKTPHVPSSGVEPMYVPDERPGGSLPTTRLPDLPMSATSEGATPLTGLPDESWMRPTKSMAQIDSFHVAMPIVPGVITFSTCASRWVRWSEL